MDRTKAGIADFSDAFAKKHKAPLSEDTETLRIYVDQSSMELYVNDGSLVLTELVFPNEPYDKVQFKGDRTMVTEVSGHTFQSIWTDNMENEVSKSADF